jgi:CubicO group peptidase (beta-lactamase class C family)
MTSFISRLEDLARAHGVPGASLAVWSEGRLVEAASGVVNLNTGVAATPEALFQIGSITKLYVSAMCMQLVEEGKLTLDDPVRRWLPGFKLADEDVAARLTLRHLLTHQSGIEGDYFEEAGRGEDRIEKFVNLLGDLDQVHPMDAMFSYCNTGFVIAGRLIEVAGGALWDRAIRQRLAKPLETPAFSTLPEQAIRHLTAIGHLGAPERLIVTPVAYLAQSNAPAGTMSMAKARDVVTFARMLMAGGMAPNGTRLLSEASVKAMLDINVTCPPRMNIDAIGLATFLWDWDGDGTYETFGHDGSTIGQAAWMRIHPASGTVFVLLTNGGNGKALAQEMMNEVFKPLGVTPGAPPQARQGVTFDAARYTGTYENVMQKIEVSAEDNGQLVAHFRPAPHTSVMIGTRSVPLSPVDESLFVGVTPGFSENATYHFLQPDHQGCPQYLHFGVRAHRRVEA